MEIHLDLLGGIAGDMFIAAILDAFPELQEPVVAAIDMVLGPGAVRCSLGSVSDRSLRGSRFSIGCDAPRKSPEPASISASYRRVTDGLSSVPTHSLTGEHAHMRWSSIRQMLLESRLDEETKGHAVAIFSLLADAEAFVHGVSADEVTFHEVGAWDSIGDIVGAARLITAIGATVWTCSAVPLGCGRVNTAHGILPVPAPATVRLLQGMPTVDDQIDGERITPTGAAILRHVCPPSSDSSIQRPRILLTTGTGIGSRKLKGIANILRILCFEACESSEGDRRQIHVLEFEVDDQSGEDLAMGLDRLRAHQAVLDVTHVPVFGKKGRMMASVRVLVRAASLEDVVEACFRETTTIGLRHRLVDGIGLRRTVEEVEIEGCQLRVKVAERPGGATAKTEADDVLRHTDHACRARIRSQAEAMVLDRLRESSHAE